MNNKLLVLGTVAYDAIETPFGKTGKILGGCATYIGLAASHFNTECGLISIIGSDFEEEHLNLLKEKNLNLEGVNINCSNGSVVDLDSAVLNRVKSAIQSLDRYLHIRGSYC